MKKIYSLIVLLIMCTLWSYAADGMPEYQIEGAGVGAQGTYLVAVTINIKDAKKVDNSMLARCAVHGVLFKGFASKENRQSHKPLAGSPSAEASHADFYSNFFNEGGAASNYGSVVPSSTKKMKSGKKYLVTAVVSVNKDQLQRDLEDAGVLKGLNSLF